jgi:UDPglucose 6-dehydrogenase
VGTGYLGLSMAVLLSQHNAVWALDIVADKVWHQMSREGITVARVTV